MASIIIESDQFKYPTKEERSEIEKTIPKLHCFDFEYRSEVESILIKKMTYKEASNNGNLYWWDNCLKNRIGKLRETFIYTLTNYNRGFSDEDHSKEQDKCRIVNGILFEYYAEIFYYYFFSTRDIIAQIIRLYYNIDINEEKLHFNYTFIKKIKDTTAKELSNSFIETTKKASEYRNASAHRFTPTLKDYRSVISENNGKSSLIIGGGKIITSKEIVDNINGSINSLSVFLEELSNAMNK